MTVNKIEMNDYILGLLYGDGCFLNKEGREMFLFSTVHKELAEKVEEAMKDNDVRYGRYVRNYKEGKGKDNYEGLELIEVYDKRLLLYLEENNLKSEEVSRRIRLTSDFLRGFLETKGTLFQSSSRGNIFWRISWSGSKEDLTYLKTFFDSNGIVCSQVVHRKDREKLGIISSSYRLNIQNRKGVASIIDYIEGEDMSLYLKERVKGFKIFHQTSNFNVNKVFKHYKTAAGFMAKEMDLTLKGIRGITIIGRQKPVFLFKEEDIQVCFRNWEHAYHWISEEYKEKVGKNPPKVADATK